MSDSGHADRVLVRRLLRGDERAFEEFFLGHFSRLYRFALSRMDRNADAAEDVVQTTLCTAISALHTYRGEAALFTWLCTICRREIGAWFRRHKRERQSIEPIEDTPEIRAALESLADDRRRGPESDLYRTEIARIVQTTLDALPTDYGNALEMKYARDLSVKEIAAHLGLSPKAAESMLTRARQAFRDGFTALTGIDFGFDSPEG